ncbi:MAG TPA: benzoate-CoA ligase family protein [Kofleriaceae bacterium]|nr:benzoate-CoA ligase family protein [Kofleriaceae bacterium]
MTVDRSQSPSRLSFAPGFNVAAPFIDRHVREGRGARVAIRCREGDVTYAELAANVDRCGNALRRAGLAPGERMLMVVKDCPEFFYLFWGAIKAAIIPVPLNVILRAADYRAILDDSAAAAVVFSPEFAVEVEGALTGPEERRPTPARATAEPPPSDRPRSIPRIALPVEGDEVCLRRLMGEAPAELEPVAAEATAPCFWLYTSGSTGRPKGAVHRHRDMVVTSELFGRGVLGVQADDVIFSAAKLFFAYGLGNAMTFPLWAGGTSVLLDVRPTAQNTLETIERTRPTLYFGVPTLYASQLQVLETASPDLSSLRVCVSAGEPLPAELYRRWKQRTGLTILDGLGSTEALNTFLSNRPGDVRPGTSGRPVPGYEVRILGPGGGEAAPGEQGRLQVRGDSTAICYWNDPERTARSMQGDWLDTGDTYFRDDDGYYHHCGRSDDMMKVGGIWCSPSEIESRLMEHADVREAAVVGVPDAHGILKPEAWVVLRDGVAPSDALAEALVTHCKSHLARYKFPRRVHFVGELPRTATGKVQRYLLRQQIDPDRRQ